MTDNSLAKRRKENAEAMDEDRLIQKLSPAQQKYAQHAVLTNLADPDIATRLGVTTYMVKKWKKDPFVQRYTFLLQKKMLDDDFLKKVKINNQQLYSKMSAELASRFERPNEQEDLSPDASSEERMMYHKRFAANAEFKDLAKVFEHFDKRVRLDTEGAPTDRVESSELREKMQERFMRIQMRRKRLNHELDKAGLDFTPAHMKVLEHDDEGGFKEVEQTAPSGEDYDEVVIEEYSLLREKNGEEDK